MKSTSLLLIVVPCLFLIGCPAYSVYPLYTDQDAVVEPALEGTWYDPESHDKGGITFQKSGDHEYTMASLDPDSKISQSYNVHLVRLGDQLFMDLIFENQTLNGEALSAPMGVVPTHVITKVKISGEDFAFATLEGDAIKKQNAAGGARLDYQISEAGLLVTSQPDALRRYIFAHAEDAFPDSGHLKRKAKAPAKP